MCSPPPFTLRQLREKVLWTFFGVNLFEVLSLLRVYSSELQWRKAVSSKKQTFVTNRKERTKRKEKVGLIALSKVNRDKLISNIAHFIHKSCSNWCCKLCTDSPLSFLHKIIAKSTLWSVLYERYYGTDKRTVLRFKLNHSSAFFFGGDFKRINVENKWLQLIHSGSFNYQAFWWVQRVVIVSHSNRQFHKTWVIHRLTRCPSPQSRVPRAFCFQYKVYILL